MSINVQGVYAVASHFKAQHLSPLQFAKPRNSGQPKADRAAAARKPSGPQTAGDAHFDQVMARSADLLARTKVPTKAETPAGKAIINDANRARGRDHAVLAAQDRGHVASVRDSLAHFDTAKAEVFRSHVSRTAPSTPPAPAPSTPAAPAPSTTSFVPQKPSRKLTPEHLGSLRPAGSPATPASTPAPVKSAAQFPQKAPKKEDYRKAASPAPRPVRTYHAPTPTQMTPPAGQPAPKRSVSDSAWSAMLNDSIAEHKASKTTAAPTPAKPSVSDSDWHSMLSDSVAEHTASKAKAAASPSAPATKAPAKKAAPSKPASAARAVIRNGSPTASGSSKSNVRETTLKKNGKEHVIRTEHNGSQKELEAKHTAAVKSFLGAAYAPDVKAAEDAVTWEPRAGHKTVLKRELAETKRKAAGYTHDNPVRGAVKRKTVNRMYGTKEQLSMFEGDGPDDPKKSHEYGIKK